ncbi:MAG: hypothetical protein ACNA8R_03100 [Nitriliruptoraceae bacterium]
MSRVHCVDCATSVVVDPQGVCPEGHHVGAGGARVEAAMGSRTAHPDEPEPWVHRIDPARTPVGVGSRANGHHAAPARELRPVRVPGVLAADLDDEPTDADALLRELHSLAALEERVPAPPPVEAAAPTTGPPRPPQPPVAPRAPKLDRDAMSDAFAELSALDAPPPEPAARTTNGHGPSHNGARAVHGRSRIGTVSTPVATAADGSAPPSVGDAGEVAALFSTDLAAPTTAGPERAAAAVDTGNGAGPGGNRFDELFAAAVSAPQLRSRDRASAPTTAEPDTAAAPPTTGPPPVPGANAAPAPGPATPQPRRRRSSTTPADTAPPPRPADEPPVPPSVVAAPEPVTVASGPVLDLASFSAKGGSGRRAARKRRFGR